MPLFFVTNSYKPWWWIDEISAMFSVADVMVEGGNPTCFTMDEGFVTLFRKGRIRICLPNWLMEWECSSIHSWSSLFSCRSSTLVVQLLTVKLALVSEQKWSCTWHCLRLSAAVRLQKRACKGFLINGRQSNSTRLKLVHKICSCKQNIINLKYFY